MKNSKLYIDFHVIQTVPPSCVNRDDTGSPKTAIYGGVTRARVSSQSWKKAVRDSFKETLDESELGIRTKKIVEMVATEITKIDTERKKEEAEILAEKVINLCGVKTKDKEAGALFFMSKKQARNLAELIVENQDATKKEAQAMLNKGHGIDVALFGRMVADDPVLNADASAQVAHAISTHRVENEYDFYTAADDMASEDNAGAGMMGTVEFNSSTLYRYATVAIHGLLKELGNDVEITAKAIAAFANAFLTSMPTGMQNSFANRTLPDFALVTIRKDQPINMIGAFEKPVQNKGEGFVKKSVDALSVYIQNAYSDFASEPVQTWIIGKSDEIHGERIKLSELESLLKEPVEQFCNSSLSE